MDAASLVCLLGDILCDKQLASGLPFGKRNVYFNRVGWFQVR